MNQKFKYLFKNVGILTISNFSSKILVFLLVPLYTSVLSTVEYGTYDLIVSTMQLMIPLLTVNIVDAVMRFSMDKSKSKMEIATIGMRYVCRSILVVGLFLIISKRFNLIPDISNYIILIFLYYIFYVFNQYFIQLSKGLERVNDLAIAGALGTLAMLGFNIAFLLVFKLGLTGFFVANIMAQAIPTIYYGVRIKIWTLIKRNVSNLKLQKEMLKYCLPLITTTVGWWVNSTADKYVVTFMCGVAANGLLSVAYKIPSIINTLQNIFIQAWQISAIREYGKEETDKFYSMAFVYLNILMSFACAVLILLTKPIAHILYAKEFYGAWEYVPFLLISSVLNAASGFVGPILSATKDSNSMAKAAIYGAIVNIIFNISFVNFVGIQGAAIATVISSFVIYVVRRRASGDILLGVYYRNVMLSWICLCVQAVIEIYTNFYLGQIICIIVLTVLYKPLLKMFIHKVLTQLKK